MERIIHQDDNMMYGKYYFLLLLSVLTLKKSTKLEAWKQQAKKELEEEKEITRL
ncbi:MULTISPECIES: hypothetical protein [Sediminibacillus]|uniref:hypothetical protein n=1 Tax=Sediminibacillus TaxID=482460 RepID=UPI0004045B04|nr:hypothetical protein [Sediminibacillus terrae]